jgi:Rieske Fe-S protein
MSDDPQRRFESDLALDARVDSPGREGLTGSARGDLYERRQDNDRITTSPDQRPMDEQPRWRTDFAIDLPEHQFVARREFAKFLVLTSGAFVAGQGWIAAQQLVRHRRAAPAPKRIGALSAIELGSVTMFSFPGEHDPCLLIRTHDGALLAYSQRCTHLACAVVPNLDEDVLYCPCHNGYFDLRTGRNVAGPPPRPLPTIELHVEGDEVYAVAVKDRVA